MNNKTQKEANKIQNGTLTGDTPNMHPDKEKEAREREMSND